MSDDGRQRENPYVGLRPFESEDSLYFFGRNSQIRDLLPSLQTSRFLAVVGGSGCGKSSLVRAGLIPTLEAGFLVEDRDTWLIRTLRPGDRPRRRLCEAILGLDPSRADAAHRDALDERTQRDGVEALLECLHPMLEDRRSNLLLLVDQFEELFQTDRQDGVVLPSEESRDFVQLILQLASSARLPIYIVLTLRSDFLGDCALFDGLAEAMNRSQYLVPRLGFAQRREAIVGPAALESTRISPRLVDRLLSEQLDTHDDLPVLQHALRRTWTHWHARGAEGDVTLEDYLAVGTVHDALNRDAEEALKGLGVRELEVVQRLFQALTVTDSANRRVRRPRRLKLLSAITGAPESALREIIERFTGPDRSFLVVSAEDDPRVDISHESLIRQWRRLQQWVDEEAKSAATFRRLVDGAARHHSGEAALYRSADLVVARRWRTQQRPNEAWARQYEPKEPGAGRRLQDALDFLAASQRRRAWLLASIVMAFGLMIALTVLLYLQGLELKKERDNSLNQTKIANKEKDNALAATLAAEKQAKSNLVLAISNSNLVTNLQVSSNSLALSYASLTNLYTNLLTLKSALVETNNALSDQTRRAEDQTRNAQNAEWQRTTNLFESHLRSATLLAQTESYADALAELRMSRELEGQIVSGHIDAGRVSTRNLLEWNVRLMSRTAIRTNLEAGVALRDVAASLDARWLIVAGENGRAALFDLSQSRSFRPLVAHTGTILAVEMDPQGRWAVTAGQDNRVIRWSVPDAKRMEEQRLSAAAVATALSPDGRWIAAAGRDGVITVWALDEWSSPVTLPGKNPEVSSITFSPDSRRLAAGLESGRLEVWTLAQGQSHWRQCRASRSLIQSGGVIRELAFDDEGTLLATGCEDGTIPLWNAEQGTLVRRLRGHRSRVGGLAFVRISGRRVLISAGADLKLRYWDTETGNALAVLEGHTAGVTGLAVASNHCFSSSNDESWREWDLAPSQTTLLLTQAVARATCCVLAPDASFVAVGSSDGEIRVFGIPERVERWRLSHAHETEVSRLALSPDGLQLASVGFDGRVKLWDVVNHRLNRELGRRAGPIHAAAFSPKGTQLAIAGSGNEAELTNPPPAVIDSSRRGEVVLFDLRGGPPRSGRAYRGDALSVSFDETGTRLISSGVDADAPVRWWRVDSFPSGSQDVPGTKGLEIAWASFRPGGDGNMVGVVGRNGILRLSDLLGRRHLPELKGHENSLVRVEFSPDGAQSLTVSTDGTLRAWDLSEQRELFALRLPVEGRRSTLRDFSFLPRTPEGQAWLGVPMDSGNVLICQLGAIYP